MRLRLKPVRRVARMNPAPALKPRRRVGAIPTIRHGRFNPATYALFLLADHFDQVLDRADHAAHGRRILKHLLAADLAQAQPAQGRREIRCMHTEPLPLD